MFKNIFSRNDERSHRIFRDWVILRKVVTANNPYLQDNKIVNNFSFAWIISRCYRWFRWLFSSSKEDHQHLQYRIPHRVVKALHHSFEETSKEVTRSSIFFARATLAFLPWYFWYLALTRELFVDLFVLNRKSRLFISFRISVFINGWPLRLMVATWWRTHCSAHLIQRLY